jgi:hypothetical protein
MSNFEKEHGRIQEFKDWVYKDVLNQQINRVEAGSFSNEHGQRYNLAIDTVGYWQRFIYEPTEPRILKWVKGWNVSLEEKGSEKNRQLSISKVYIPLVYRTDLEELPSGILVPLLGRIDQIQSNWRNDRSLLTISKNRF